MMASINVGEWMSESRTRVYLVVFLLMVLPIVFFAYSVGELLRHQAETHAITESAQIARISAASVEEHFRQSTAFLESIASRPMFRQAWIARDAESMGWNLKQASELYPGFAFVSAYGLDGTVRATYPLGLAILNRNFAYRDWYKGVAREWKPYISEVYQTANPPYPLVVAVAVPIRDGAGKPIGILMAPIPLDTMSRELVQTRLEGAWTISVVDQSGHLSARPNINAYSPAIDLSAYEPVRRMRTGNAGYGTFVRDGNTFFARYEPLGHYGWGILVEQPSAVLQGRVSAVERRVWLLGMVFALVGLGVGTFVASLYSRLQVGNRFIDLSVDMFCVAGFDGFFKNLNPAWQKTLGFTKEELLKKPYFEFIHPDDRQSTVAEAAGLEKGEVTLAFENRYLCADGSYKWLLWNAVSVREQKVIYAVARDVTETRRLEEVRRHLAALVASSEDAIISKDLNGTITAWNSGAEKIFGYPASEAMGKSINMLLPPNRAGEESDILARIRRGERVEHFETVRVHKDGRHIDISATVSPIKDSHGAIVGASKIARNINDRKKAEDLLQQSEERHRKLFDNNPHPTWAYDRDTLRFLAVNQAAIKQYGYSKEEFLAMTIKDIWPPEDVPGLLKSVAELCEETKTMGIWKHRRKDGTNLDVEITSYRMNFASRNAVVVVAVDVTQRQLAEAEKQQFTEMLAASNQKLELRNREVERATRMKSKFLASMSHELRTPLNAIVGFSDLLSEESPGALNPKQKRFVNHIKQGSAHLLQLINDILDLSKIEAGQLELRCEQFFVTDALPEVLSTIRPLAMAKNIQIQQEIRTEHSVLADRVRFKQILYNLLSNAVKFTPKDGHIEVACADEGTSVCISVTDSGIGIKPEDQAVIFEEFRQVESPTGTVQEGTGLGLAITKRLVERQKGIISVESTPGKGSRFTFTLPVGSRKSQQCITAEPENVPHVAAGSGKPLVLIVDDEPPARELIASYLNAEYRTVMASTGAEALEMARQLRPDAITLDVLMAGGNGFETLAVLRQTPELATTPVIIVSIVDQTRVGLALGAADYLLKPIRRSLLLESLRKHVPSQSDEDDVILLVDDDPATLELLQEALCSAGYETQAVQTGTRALEVLSSKLVSAVLLDLLMPGLDGFEVIRHVRQESAFKDLPILVMTSKTLTQEESAILAQDTQALFYKNRSWREQLIREVGRVIQGRKLAKSAGQV